MTHRISIDGLLEDSLVRRLESIVNSDSFKGTATIEPYVIPETAFIMCSIVKAKTADGQVIAKAVHNGVTINTCLAPTAERALAALGLNTPDAFSHQLYRKQFGSNYVLKDASTYHPQ